MNYAVEQRLRLIDFLAAQYGRVGRPQLQDYFGISAPQATNDLNEYRRLTGNLQYNSTLKTYVRSVTFKRYWPAD